MRRPALALAFAFACASLAACAADGGEVAPATPATPPALSATPRPAAPAVDLAAVGANELGKVPVLMYHQLIENARREEDRTPAEFRAELEMLQAQGYRPVTAADFVAGRIDLPAGTHPVVLTFDDSTISQAQIGPDGEPAPGTALGILEAFGAEHPEFAPTATFYINTFPEPFVDDAVLPWLAANGYEIGAHTRSHAALRKLDDAGVQAEIGRNVAELEAAVPGYEVTTFATTYGIGPVNRELARRGVHDGMPYEFTGVFGVDAVAAPSPYAATFTPFNVPRVGSGLAVAEVALAQLRTRPETRFTSDGDPDRVSFPSALADQLAPAWRDRARPY